MPFFALFSSNFGALFYIFSGLATMLLILDLLINSGTTDIEPVNSGPADSEPANK